MKKVNIISLGCSKNLVDTELLMKQLEKAGYGVEVDVENSKAKIVVINTCGFIGDAKEESINTILEQVERKQEGEVEKIYVMGCLSQRYDQDLKKEIPEVDAYFGKFDWKGILAELGKSYDEKLRNERHLTTPKHYAYLKISEGCNRGCSYCAIPIMTGEYKSRPFEEIVDEAERLAKQGVKELLVLAQVLPITGLINTEKTGWLNWWTGLQIYRESSGLNCIMLTRPGSPMELLTVMRERKNVCKYLDIALQHCSDHMLKMMRRGVTKQQTVDLINKIREEVPGIALRTTLMVGHPGETEEDYRELEDFVKTMKFERLGVFPYSHEDDTYCDKHYQDDVPEETKNKRAEKLMALQEGVIAAINESCVGKRFLVLNRSGRRGLFCRRTQYDSPEVDQEVFVTSEKALQIGEFYEVLITESGQFELYAKYE